METVQEIEKQKKYIKEVAKQNKGKNLKYYILTMGCQLNKGGAGNIVRQG